MASSPIAPITEDVLSLVLPKFHASFRRFVDTGELDPEFEDYLDHDIACQRAVEAAAEAQLTALSAMGRQLREAAPTAAFKLSMPDVGRGVADSPDVRAGYANIAAGFELVVNGVAQVGSTETSEETPDLVQRLDSALAAKRIMLPEQTERLTVFLGVAQSVAAAVAEQHVPLGALHLASER